MVGIVYHADVSQSKRMNKISLALRVQDVTPAAEKQLFWLRDEILHA